MRAALFALLACAGWPAALQECRAGDLTLVAHEDGVLDVYDCEGGRRQHQMTTRWGQP